MDEVKSIYDAACKHPNTSSALRLIQQSDNNGAINNILLDNAITTNNTNTTTTNNNMNSNNSTSTIQVSKRVRISNSNYIYKENDDQQHHQYDYDDDQASSSSSLKLAEMKPKHQYIIPNQLRSMLDVDNLLQASIQFGLNLEEETKKLQQVRIIFF